MHTHLIASSHTMVWGVRKVRTPGTSRGTVVRRTEPVRTYVLLYPRTTVPYVVVFVVGTYGSALELEQLLAAVYVLLRHVWPFYCHKSVKKSHDCPIHHHNIIVLLLLFWAILASHSLQRRKWRYLRHEVHQSFDIFLCRLGQASKVRNQAPCGIKPPRSGEQQNAGHATTGKSLTGRYCTPWYMYKWLGALKKHSLTSKKPGMAWYQRHIVESVYLTNQSEIYQLSRLFVKLLIWASQICINYVYWLKLQVLFVCYYIVIFDETMTLAGYDLRIRTQKNFLHYGLLMLPQNTHQKIQQSSLAQHNTGMHWHFNQQQSTLSMTMG